MMHSEIAKAIDGTCRNHGTCTWCEGNRLHNSRKKELRMDYGEEEIRRVSTDKEV